MEIEETLKEIGLEKEEIKIYLALLKKGPCLASIIANETKINRSHVYQLLGRIISKGFSSYVIRENRKYFNAVSPEKILEIVREREYKLKNILPTLISLTNISEERPQVEILEGKEGIKTILNDILRTKKEWFAFGSGKSPEVLSFYSEHWEKERVKNKILMKAILDKSSSGILRGKTLSRLRYTKIKYLEEQTSSPSSNWIYGDKVAIITWTKEHSFAIRIESKEISESYKKYFNSLWEIAKR